MREHRAEDPSLVHGAKEASLRVRVECEQELVGQRMKSDKDIQMIFGCC